MTMPPAGVNGLMDEQAVIDAEIQLELENINLDDEVNYNDDIGDNLALETDSDEQDVQEELDVYIKRLQDQSSRFEQELQECDELLTYTSRSKQEPGNALIPYEDQNLLMQLAKEHGCDVEEYTRKILEDIENDDVVIDDSELADLIGNSDNPRNGEEQCSTENAGSGPVLDGGLSVKIEKAVEEGVDPVDMPVSQDLVPVNGHYPAQQIEMQKMLKEQLERLELRYQERIEKIKKDEAFKRDEEEVRERRINEERQWKIEEIHRQEQQLMVEREMADREVQREQEEVEKEMQETLRKFQEEMTQLQNETEKQKKELKIAVEMERKRQKEKQNKAAVDIQRTYRGYKVRKQTKPVLEEKNQQWKKEREEQRIREVEIDIERRKEEQRKQEEMERERLEEEKRQKEELKRKKEEEKKRMEEEKRRKKEEEERIKQEEKRIKEEEKQRKKEEEKRRKEEEKRIKEEEEQRKREEKKQKEEEEKRRKAEEKRLKEEEKKRKEEEKRKKEEEELRKKEEKRKQEEEEKRRKEEGKRLQEEQKKIEAERKLEEERRKKEEQTEHVLKEGREVFGNNVGFTHISGPEESTNNSNSLTENGPKHNQMDSVVKLEHNFGVNAKSSHVNQGAKEERRSSTPRSSRSSRTPRPSTPKTENKEAKKREDAVKPVKEETKHDSLPDHLEALRLKFMKEYLPWSKIGNEPWKLKAGVSKKPLRRPSSAKKLPLLSEDIIVQAAKVASLKMVTTVELKDLPGNNISILGQCGGLKYLTMTNCNLVSVEGLNQCKHLQYINIKNNKIEYVDLKDVGQLQVLNLSHNKLSAVHGLDNCTNLRWLDVSHNNITRLGGLETLRRLHTLKLSHNQLLSTQGLGCTPTLQILDISHNHLQSVEDIEKLCLLLSVDASSNNLLNIPSLHNQVLLLELLLSDNSITTLSVLASVWLPLLSHIDLEQNSISELPSLQNCLLLKDLNLSENQISALEAVSKCVEACFYLEQLNLEDNPVITDFTESFMSRLKCSCPRLNVMSTASEGTAHNSTPMKPRNSFEAMSLTHLHTLREIINHFQHSMKGMQDGSQRLDQAQICDIYYKFCERTFNTAVEYRYAHEYGEVSINMPSAPTAPKSGRPLSSRQREKYMNPKEMFENALKSSQTDSKMENSNSVPVNGNPRGLFNNAVKQEESKNLNQSREKPGEKFQLGHGQQSYSSPKDLFEQALRTADQLTVGAGEMSLMTQSRGDGDKVLNKQVKLDHKTQSEEKHTKAATTIQAYYRGWHVRHEISEHTKMWLAATTIQAVWRGYWCRKQLKKFLHRRDTRMQGHPAWMNLDPIELEHWNKSAVTIQANWRGYILRKKLMAALEYAQCDFGDDDEDAMNLGDEFDFDKFMEIDQDLLDSDWKPPATPDLPSNYPVLKKPPSGKPRVPPLNPADLHPPSNPRRAWRNLESPLSDMGKIPHPPSSVASTELTMRSGVSKKEEKMAEEWGFKDTGTAHLMMQRAKKMKYNAERRKKISKLDPKQRLALFNKLQEVTHPMTHAIPQRKTLPRKEYFQARQDEIVRQEHEKRQEFKTRVSRTFEWLHSQVGDHIVSDSVINQGTTEGPKYIPVENLPELHNGGKRVQLVSSPMSVELQSVESASTLGQNARRHSVGSGSSASKLPPIQPSSAPAPKVKERMSFRNPVVNKSVGWGGGKKRSGKK